MSARRVAVLLLALCLGLLAACGGGAEPEVRDGRLAELRVGYQEIPNGDLIVKRQGWLEDELGIPVRWRRYDSGASVSQALEEGSIDVGLVGSSGVALALQSGVDERVVWVHDVIGDSEALVARGRVRSLSDLEGATVGVPFGSTAHYSLLAALDRAGVDVNRVDVLDLQPDEIEEGWQAGDLDAAYVWEPVLSSLRSTGGRDLVTSGQLADEGVVTADLGVWSDRTAERFPDAVQTWVDAQARAVELLRDRPDEAARILGEELGVTTERARAEMRGYRYPTAEEQAGVDYLGSEGGLAAQLAVTAEFLKDYPQAARFLKEQGALQPLPSASSYADHIDPTFVKGVR
ncbi:ABC transporter substrate-binding protein [Nocardioides rotundus]|uniref:taurine ABC transporter substrate-binding protein n=1 Tax=Nocardioides rotundus TaxID=1774216 RepID=UPI001CBC7C21|nr:glycine betaine ABC transporter substrate-binding protein [Nocardioides rotundus]UAL30174.1 ABC transporter substrate-binding protein [Nocardioides rotundus]